MRINSKVPLFRSIAGNVTAAPAALLAYVAFAVVVTFWDCALLLHLTQEWHASAVPFTGWNASTFYAFSIVFAVALIFQHRRRRQMTLSITILLVVQIAYGIFQLCQADRPNFGNPYLTVSPWRPVWTILIPTTWIVVLHTPSLNRFCRLAQESNVD